MTYARRESIRERMGVETKIQIFIGEHIRMRRLIVAIHRSRTVRSSSVRDMSGSGKKWTNLNTPEARMASIDPVLHKAKTDKQPKVKEGMMKKPRLKSGKAMSHFIIYNRLPPSRQISLDTNVDNHRRMWRRNEGSFLVQGIFSGRVLEVA